MKKMLLIGTTLVVLLLVGLGALFILRLPPVVEQIPSSPTLLARIQSPFDQSDVPSDLPTTIRATSFGTDAVTTLQLWVNGLPVDSKTNVSPSNQFDADFAWQPFDYGDYSLIVRAIDQNGRIATSSAVHVRAFAPSAVIDLTIKTTIGDTLESLAEEYEVPLDHLLLLNPKIDPKQPLKPDQEINIPIGLPPADIAQPPALLPPLPASPAPPSGSPKLILPALPNPAVFALGNLFGAPKAPIAPEVATSVEGCKTNIFISDQAKNETGFFLYQLKGNENAFKRIAVFDANTDSSPLKYVIESSPLGSTQYYVAAFNAAGELPSDIVIAHLTDANCAKNETPKSKFKEPALVLKEPVEKLYCYTSLDDLPWKRIPADPNLFLSSPNTKFDLASHLGEFTPSQQDATLEMECWGWKGGALKNLGKGIQIIKAKQTGALNINGAAFTFTANLDVAPLSMPQLAITPSTIMSATPSKIIPAPFSVKAESDKPNNQNLVLWNWIPLLCFPPAAGQPAKECQYENDIEGFKIYNEQGVMIKNLSGAKLTSSVVGLSSTKCYTVTAFKGTQESKKSKAGCLAGEPKAESETTKSITPPNNLRQTTDVSVCVNAAGGASLKVWCEAAFKNKIPVLVWDWTKQSCFPPAAGETPKPCSSISDIDGFNIYDSQDGKPLFVTSQDKSVRMFMLVPSNTLITDYCFSVRAYKGTVQSAASNTLCVKPSLPPVVTLKPRENKSEYLTIVDVLRYENSACFFDKVHNIVRQGGPNNGDKGSMLYYRLSITYYGPPWGICNRHWAVSHETAHSFSLKDFPSSNSVAQATLRFTSADSRARVGTSDGATGKVGVPHTPGVSCLLGLFSYHYKLGINQEADADYIIGSTLYTFAFEDLVTNTMNANANAVNEFDVTSIVQKSLQQGKTYLGFVWHVDQAIHDDNDSCFSTFVNPELEIKTKK